MRKLPPQKPGAVSFHLIKVKGVSLTQVRIKRCRRRRHSQNDPRSHMTEKNNTSSF